MYSFFSKKVVDVGLVLTIIILILVVINLAIS